MEIQPNNQQDPEELKKLALRGVQLMARHRNLVSLVADRELDVEVLLTFTQGLSETDFDLMVQAEMEAAKVRSKKVTQSMALTYGDEPLPLGRR